MGEGEVMLNLFHRKLEVTSDSLQDADQTFTRSRHTASCRPPELASNSRIPRHRQKPKALPASQSDGHEPTVPFTAVVLRFYQHKSG